MKTNKVTLQAEFSTDTRFELLPAVPFRVTSEDEFRRLKGRMLADRLEEAGAKWETPLRNAAGEAAALAWTTPIPLLVFPTLFEEKAATAILQGKRQERIFERSRELLAA